MKRLMTTIGRLATSTMLLLLLARPASAGNYCNNPVPPCDPNNPASECYRPPDPPPKCEPKQCNKCTKSPCYVGSGVYAYDARDLEIATTGFSIKVTRLYQSTRAIDGESGYGWTSSLSSRLYYATYLKAAPSTYEKEADIRLPNGTLYRFTENADGSFTPPEGRFDVLVHNGDGTWDLWLQRSRSRYHFSATGNLLAMIDDFGNTQTWTYVNDRLQHIEDTSGSGRSIDITYGADGRISDVTDMTGRNVHYTYNASGVLVSMTNPAAQTTTYSYVAGKYVPLLSEVRDHWNRVLTNVVYDAQDRVRSYTDKGETFTYTYNYNNVSTTTAKSDSSGNTWLYPFGSGGVVTDSIPPGGGAGAHDDYYSNGLVQLHTDAMGVKTHYTYNAQGNPLTITYDYQGATAVEWRHVYDSQFPDLLATITPYTPGTNNVHPHWQARKFDFYPTGSASPGAVHHIYEVDDDGTTSRVIRTFTYDTHGRVLTDTTASDAVTTFEYDSAGNRTRIERPANNDAGVKPVQTFTYDTLGRMLTATDALGRTTSFTWDVLNRIVTVTEPPPTGSGSPFVTTNYYDEYDSATQALFKRVVDPNGQTSRWGYDAWGQLVRRINTLGHSLRYTFTKGLLTAKTDENNYVTGYAWDARRRLSQVTYPDGTYESYTYFADGKVASFRNRAAQIVTFTYDRHKRPATQTFPGGGSYTWTYNGQKLVSVADTFASPSETNTMTWNAAFRLVSETQGPRGTITYSYTSEGRVASEAVSGGASSTYDYYPNGSLKSIEWSPVTGSFDYEYTLDGRTSSITFPNGQTRTYSYDALGRVTQLANVHPTAGNLATFTYGHDVDAFTGQPTKLGLRTSVVTDFPALSLSSATTKFDYDALGRLIRTDYPSAAPYNGLSSAWVYDAAGNRTSASTNGVSAAYTYATYASNPLYASALLSDGANSYTYDAKGNTLTRSGTGGNTTFGWSIDNRLVSISGTQSATYKYDLIGRRASKTVAGATTTYVYSDLNVVSESGADPAQYLQAPGVDMPLAMQRGGAIYYYDVDALGSIVAVNDSAGVVKNSYAWDAWGGTFAANETVANPFGFTAREDGEAGLTYYRNRYYEPATGSFRSVDPLVSLYGYGLANGYNAPGHFADYAYADGAPSMFTDPFGLDDCEKCFRQHDDDVKECVNERTLHSAACFAILGSCLRFTKSWQHCGIIFIFCAIAVDEAFNRCMKSADRAFKQCLEGCGLCLLPPPPPPQYTPVPPSPPAHAMAQMTPRRTAPLTAAPSRTH